MGGILSNGSVSALTCALSATYRSPMNERNEESVIGGLGTHRVRHRRVPPRLGPVPSSSAGRTYGPARYHGSDEASAGSGSAWLSSSVVFGSLDVRNGENVAGASSLAERVSGDPSSVEASGEGVEDDGVSESVLESDRVVLVYIEGESNRSGRGTGRRSKESGAYGYEQRHRIRTPSPPYIIIFRVGAAAAGPDGGRAGATQELTASPMQ